MIPPAYVGGLSCSGRIMSTTFENVHYSLELGSLISSLRIVLLSDLHMAEHGPGNRYLLEACKREQPDLILMAGDLITNLKKNPPGYPEAISDVIGFAAKLADIAPVYAVNGNHETKLRMKPGLYRIYAQGLKNAGICLLNNRSRRTVVCGNTLILTGLELGKRSYHKFRRPSFSVDRIRRAVGDGGVTAAGGHRISGSSAASDGFCKSGSSAASDGFCKSGSSAASDGFCKSGSSAASDGFCVSGNSAAPCRILLAHNPVFAPFYMEWGADLTVCGHFHGGVMRLRGKQPLLSPYGFLLPEYGYGHFEKDGKHVIVSSGLGEHAIPFRIHNPMELVSIDLTPADAGARNTVSKGVEPYRIVSTPSGYNP